MTTSDVSVEATKQNLVIATIQAAANNKVVRAIGRILFAFITLFGVLPWLARTWPIRFGADAIRLVRDIVWWVVTLPFVIAEGIGDFIGELWAEEVSDEAKFALRLTIGVIMFGFGAVLILGGIDMWVNMPAYTFDGVEQAANRRETGVLLILFGYSVVYGTFRSFMQDEWINAACLHLLVPFATVFFGAIGIHTLSEAPAITDANTITALGLFMLAFWLLFSVFRLIAWRAQSIYYAGAAFLSFTLRLRIARLTQDEMNMVLAYRDEQKKKAETEK